MMRIVTMITVLLKTVSGLIAFASAASWAGALPSAKFGENELEAVTSVNDYVYYELNLGTDVFDCSGTIPVTMPVLSRDAASANYQQPLLVIKAKKAAISEGCSFKAENRNNRFDVLIIASEDRSEIDNRADPLSVNGWDATGFRVTGPSGSVYFPSDTALSAANSKLADILTSGTTTGNCVVKSIVLTKLDGKCGNRPCSCGNRKFQVTVSGSGTCTLGWDSYHYFQGNYRNINERYNFDENQGKRIFPEKASFPTNGGNNKSLDWNMKSLKLTVGGISRHFSGKEIYDGVSLDITKVGGESGEKTAGKEAYYRVRVMDGGQECTSQSLGVKAGLLRSTDNEKSDVKAQVKGKEIGFVSSSGDEPPTEIKLDSVGSGSEKGAGFGFDYRDFGQSTLYVSVAPGYNVPGATHKSGDGSLPLVLRGSVETTSFPQGICLKYSEDNSRKLCSGGCELIRSGEEFLLDILPVAYSGRDDDPLDCSDANVRSRVLPSFRMKDIPLLRTTSREKAGNSPDPAEDRDIPAEIETMQGSDDTAVSGKFDYGSEGSLLPDGMKLRARIGSAGTFRAHIPSIKFTEELKSTESWSEELSWIYPYAYRIWWDDSAVPSELYAKSMSFCRKADSGSSKYPWFTYAGQPFRLRNARIEAINKQGGVIKNYDSSIFSHATDVPRLMPFAREGTEFVKSAETIERLPETDPAAPGWQGWTDGWLYTRDASSAAMTHDYYFRLLKDGLKAPLTLYTGVGMESISGTGRSVVCGLDGSGERFSASAPSADGTDGTGTESDVSAPDEFCAFGGKRDYSSMNFLTGRLRAVSVRTGSAGAAYVPFVAEYVSEIDEGGSPVWTQNYPDSCTVLSFGRDAESPFSFSERIVSESSVKDTAAVSPVRKTGTEHDASDAFTVTPQGGIPFSLNFSGTYRGKIENSESAAPESSVYARMRNGTAVLRLILNGNFEDYGARRADFRYVLKRSTIGHLKDTETDSFDLKSAESPVWLGDTVIGSVIFGGRVVSPRMIYLQDGN